LNIFGSERTVEQFDSSTTKESKYENLRIQIMILDEKLKLEKTIKNED